MYQNGSAITGIGRIDVNDRSGTVFVYTADRRDEGIKNTIIRGCASTNQLYEVALSFEIMRNEAPSFVSNFIRNIEVPVNERFVQALPQAVDPEGFKTTVYI